MRKVKFHSSALSANFNPSTNAVQMVDSIFKGSSDLVTSIGEAYAKIAGGASADTVMAVAQKAYSFFKSSGGDTTKASVSLSDAAKTLTVTDGQTCIERDASGNCRECSL